MNITERPLPSALPAPPYRKSAGRWPALFSLSKKSKDFFDRLNNASLFCLLRIPKSSRFAGQRAAVTALLQAFDSTRGGSRPPRTPPAKRNVFSPNRVLLTSGKARAAGPRFWRSVQASALTSRSPSPVPRAPAAAGAAPGSGPRTAPAESASGRAGRSGS